jgi:hypothetical protein
MQQRAAAGPVPQRTPPHYYALRPRKYNGRATLLLLPRVPVCTFLPYCGAWLAGFIEAAGCFLHHGAVLISHSFLLSQRFDSDILNAICTRFSVKAKVNSRTIRGAPKAFYVETYSSSTISRVIAHCVQYPLLGEKALQLQVFLLRPTPDY